MLARKSFREGRELATYVIELFQNPLCRLSLDESQSPRDLELGL